MSERLRKLFGVEEGVVPEEPELPLLTVAHDDARCKLAELAERALDIAQEEIEARKRAEDRVRYWRDRALRAEHAMRRMAREGDDV